MGFSNLVIRASAGSGKTFQLSNRYLGLAASGVAPDTILATTFTRKAAGEILDRVLIRLAEAVLDDSKLQELARFLDVGPIEKDRCKQLLATMVGRLHRLQISTLDQFFNQLGRCFSLELGLPPGWTIADEAFDRRLRARAVGDLLAKEKTTDTIRLMYMLNKGDIARSVSRELNDLAMKLYDLFLDSPQEAWEQLKTPKPLSPEQFRAAVDQLEHLESPGGKRWQNAFAADLERFLSGDWKNFFSKGIVKPIVSGEMKFYSKEIESPVPEIYLPLINHAKAMLLGTYVSQNRGTRDLLVRFDRTYQDLKREYRALRFEDIPRRLGPFFDSGRLSSAFFRLDAQVSHLLLDEFQDTSMAQWEVLRPLARRIVEHTNGEPEEIGRSFFCVGDVKQAIYSWRGGVAEIFEAIAEELDGLCQETLEQSFRSSPVVIDLVNRIFKSLKSNPALISHPKAASRWAERFFKHSTARENLAGYATLEAAPRVDEPTDQTTTTLFHAADRIAQLKQQTPWAQIGVLVRNNKNIVPLISRLKILGVETSEEGGNPLTDSPAVELIVSALKLADHPGDTVARFHLANSPLAGPLAIATHDDDRAAWAFSKKVRHQLTVDGYGPTLTEWAELVEPICSPRDAGRLRGLVELAYRCDETPPERVDRFLEQVAAEKVESPSSGDVRVMTVHKSKGLQFDIVVLPDLDNQLIGRPPEIVAGHPKPTAPIERVCRYIPKDIQPVLSKPFQEMFKRHQTAQVEESLCLLYVAITRAIHAIHIIVAPSKPNENTFPKTYAGILRAAMIGADEPLEPETVPFESGDRSWFATDGEKSGEKSADKDTDSDQRGPVSEPLPERIELAQSSSRPARSWNRRTPSSLEGNEATSVTLADRLRIDGDFARRRGTIMHGWFETIDWLDEQPIDREKLLDIGKRIDPTGSDLNSLLDQFEKAIEQKNIRAALSRSTYLDATDDPTPIHTNAQIGRPLWKVLPEYHFAVRTADEMLSGSIDRLTLLYDADLIVGADIIDFKTDRIDLAGLAERAEYYRPQLEAYREAVQKSFGLPMEKISIRLAFVRLDQVVRIG
jgi:ATP-dependent helicase/nuclease subunit A